jgi:hypothetical protein
MPGLVRPVAVVVPGVGAQHCSQMGVAVDQHPVGALGLNAWVSIVPQNSWPAASAAGSARSARPRW